MPADQLPDNQKSEHEIADYYEGVKKLEMQGHESGIKSARNALFVTAGLLLLGEVVSASMLNVPWTPFMIAFVVAEVGVFVGLALWTKYKPYTAIIVGLILFVLIWIASIATVGGKAIYSGILVKLIILYFLIKALKPAKAWEDLKKQK